MKQFYRWVALQCKKHNDKLTYIDYEEAWTPCDFLCSVAMSLMIIITLFALSGITDQIVVAIIGCLFTAGTVAWHFWHLMKY